MKYLYKKNSPWLFIPTLYFFQSIPYAFVLLLSIILYKSLEIDNKTIAFWTSLLHLPWVGKFLLGPFVDQVTSLKKCVFHSQLFLAFLSICTSFALITPYPFLFSLPLFFLFAFTSAFHDTAADGLYIERLTKKQQAFFSGIRNTAYRAGMIFAQGVLVMVVGIMSVKLSTQHAWSTIFFLVSILFFLLAFWHNKSIPEKKQTIIRKKKLQSAFSSFLKQPRIALSLSFLLLYRLGEAQLLRLTTPFLLDPLSQGGLALNTTQVGFLYGVVGITALLLGGFIGGYLGSRWPLQNLLLLFWLCINLPNLGYVWLATTQQSSNTVITSVIAIEQFGYGLGFSGYMLFMLTLCQNTKWHASHYAICTAFMALSLMLPGLFAGALQEQMGYSLFFCWTLLCSLPCLPIILILCKKLDKAAIIV